VEQSVIEAIEILNSAADEVAGEKMMLASLRMKWVRFLFGAIEHIAKPDRDVYPKTRRGTKTNPVVWQR
jgi:hypothetical protein